MLMPLCLLLASALCAQAEFRAVPKGPDATTIHGMPEASKTEGNPVPHKVAPLRETQEEVGSTRYDLQQLGSVGQMIAVDETGMAHGCYSDPPAPGYDDLKYFCVDPEGVVANEGAVAFPYPDFINLAVYGPGALDMPINGAVFGFYNRLANELAACSLAVIRSMVPGPSHDRSFLRLAVDADETLHIVYMRYYPDPGRILYWRIANDWTIEDSPVEIADTCNVVSHAVCATPDGASVAALFMQDALAANPGERAARQWHHDIFYYRSDSGSLVDLIETEAPVAVTRYRQEDSTAPLSDVLFAFTDLDATFSYGEGPDLHIAWTAPMVVADSALYRIPGSPVVHLAGGGLFPVTHKRSSIWHYCDGSGQFSHLAGWATGTGEEDAAADPGILRTSHCRPQLAVDPQSGYLYAIWNQFSSDDTRLPGEDGLRMPNGEIYAACSADSGLTWGPRINLSNTPTPDCEVGDCASEIEVSLAKRVHDGELVISYLLDLHAGCSLRSDEPNDGSEETVNPILVMRVPVGDIPPHDGTPWDAAGHVGLSSYSRTWSYVDGHPDTIQTLDRVLAVNESDTQITLDRVDVIHHVTDVLGSEESALYADIEVYDREGQNYLEDIALWDGQIHAWRAQLLRLSVGHRGLPFYEQAFRLVFSNGTERLYRYLYEGTEVLPLDHAQIDSYETTVLWERSVGMEEPQRPTVFHLEACAPNPFNPSTRVAFTLEGAAEVDLSVYNLAGQHVARLGSGSYASGRHQVVFDGEGLASGIYFVSLQVGGQRAVRKALLSK